MELDLFDGGTILNGLEDLLPPRIPTEKLVRISSTKNEAGHTERTS